MPGQIGQTVGLGMTGVGIAGQYMAGQDAAEASGKIAQQQMGAAQQTRQLAQEAAAPTAMELGTMNQQITQAGTSLKRQQALFDSIDPALMEAGKQALQLLQGKSAATVAPMLAQRQQQRAQLEQQLTQQFGPGGESSSAGAQALNNFDLQTSNYQAQLQQGTLGMLLGQANQTGASAMASGSQAGQLFGSVMGQSNAIQGRQIGAITSTDWSQYAGGQYAQQLANAKNTGRMFGQVASIGGQMSGYGSGQASDSSGKKQGGGSGGGGGGSQYGQGGVDPSLDSEGNVIGMGSQAGGGGGAAMMALA